MADPVFKVNTTATKAQAYLDYSSCGRTKATSKSTTEVTDITMFKAALKAKVPNINDANISEANLMTLFAVDADTAKKMAWFGDRDHNGLSAEELVVFLDKADAVDKKRDYQVAAQTVENFKNLSPQDFQKGSDTGSKDSNTKGIIKKGPIDKDTNNADLGAKNNDDKAITKNEPAANTNEHSLYLNHSEQGGLGLGNGNGFGIVAAAFGAFAIFAIGLSGGLGGGACRSNNNYYGYGGYGGYC